ncbi:MAG: ATP-binding cassette domain-containing protein [Pontiellaceae bacterium]|jgi:ABC-2 type transport system ATP-binding protein|nr:ATP-binding cassette domain-containing protein [Pontiellaceae bacterium]
MIKVSNLTKQFAGHTAVDNVSFEVKRGEIVGFLGPNGAGKTTTMRMLTGFLHPTQGAVEIAGCDVFDDPIEVRRHIGYMPESCPLYTEMRVDEYLKFRALIKGVARKAIRERRDTVKEQCGLTEVGHRIIGQLSKGYRQRVGLADSLLHDPDLLILDEPTAGLDPNQIREVRELIRQLAERHTLLLSTHILPEVEMTCRRILIINKGKIVASDSPESLQKRLTGDIMISAEIAGDAAVIESTLKNLGGVDVVDREVLDESWSRYRVDSSSPEIRTQVFECAASNGWKLRELHLESRSLEDIFVSIIRDDAAAEKNP